MRKLPPLKAIHVFEAAARRGSFLKTAEELYITPSAVSHQIRSLEALLGSSCSIGSSYTTVPIIH